MMRSLFSGVSGLKVHQIKMDVIGNNISNVNTIGFRGSSVTFSDVLYQTTQSASGPNATTGTAGRNAMQIGLGSGVASITASMTDSGASQRTDDPFDVMIEGDGFFIVNRGGTNYFTKAGSFQIDGGGTLCTSTGATVMGWKVDPTDPTKTVADNVSELKIMTPENLYTPPEATTDTYVKGNIDSKDTQIGTINAGKKVNMSFYDSMGHLYTADLKVWQSTTATDVYCMGITDIKDESGQSIFSKKNADGTYSATGTTFNFGGKSFTPSVSSAGVVTIGTSTESDYPVLAFNGSTGSFVGVGDSTTNATKDSLSLAITTGSGIDNSFKNINVDFSSITMYSTSGNSSLTAEKGSLTGTGAGKKVGNMKGLSIDESGRIYGKYDNGDNKLLGQIPVATFANPAGLEAVGNSMFAATRNSGDFNGVGQDPTTGGGSLTTGVLEMSNVDLSQQFTDMITTQRGFQANSRIITTSDTMLEELINLKR